MNREAYEARTPSIEDLFRLKDRACRSRGTWRTLAVSGRFAIAGELADATSYERLYDYRPVGLLDPDPLRMP